MSDFSLDLNEDQLQIQKWVHDFAENVIRPVAAEYDEKEETPWPIIQEAANIGLYSQEAMTSFFSDPTGLTFPLDQRGAGVGLRGHRARDLRHDARRVRHPRQRHAGADRRVGPAVLRHPRRHPHRRVRGERARRRLRRQQPAHAAPSTTRPRTSGCSTAPRRGSPTAASTRCRTCTSWSRRSSPS